MFLKGLSEEHMSLVPCREGAEKKTTDFYSLVLDATKLDY